MSIFRVKGELRYKNKLKLIGNACFCFHVSLVLQEKKDSCLGKTLYLFWIWTTPYFLRNYALRLIYSVASRVD